MSSNSARRSAVQAITTYKPEASPLNFYDTKPTDIFGCNVFTDKVMRERLPKDVYMPCTRPSNSASAWIPASPIPWPPS